MIKSLNFLKKPAAFIFIFLFTAWMAVFSAYAETEQVWPEVPELAGEAVVLMEANTQAVIYQKNADKQMYPASTTKILTALVVLEHCSLNETVTFTEECCDLEEGAVTIDSVPGEQMSLKDVMYGLLLPSGNDCAMALALHVAGSVEAFADMMNEKAKEIGATSSHFANPSGLYNYNHYTTANDLTAIARYAFQNSTFVDIISHSTYIIEPTNKTPESRVLTNTHEMIIPGNPDYNSHVIGGKTGYLYEAGRCLVTYAEKDGITLLSVILDGSYYGIFSETQELLDFGWNHFTIVNVSETERRFSYADDTARVQMDSSNQILTLNNVPFEDLTAEVNYAYYLNEDEYARAKEEAGITEGDLRQLYAWIDYSYAGYYLGSCNIFINPLLEVPTVTFIHVLYMNIWLVLLVVLVVVLGVILLVRLAKKAAATGKLSARAHRKSGRGRVRYYSRSDSIDLHNQYIKTSDRDRGSIHDLDEIGVSPEGRVRAANDSARRRRAEERSRTEERNRTEETDQRDRSRRAEERSRTEETDQRDRSRRAPERDRRQMSEEPEETGRRRKKSVESRTEEPEETGRRRRKTVESRTEEPEETGRRSVSADRRSGKSEETESQGNRSRRRASAGSRGRSTSSRGGNRSSRGKSSSAGDESAYARGKSSSFGDESAYARGKSSSDRGGNIQARGSRKIEPVFDPMDDMDYLPDEGTEGMYQGPEEEYGSYDSISRMDTTPQWDSWDSGFGRQEGSAVSKNGSGGQRIPSYRSDAEEPGYEESEFGKSDDDFLIGQDRYSRRYDFSRKKK